MKIIRCIAVDDEPSALDVISIHSSKMQDLDLIESFSNSRQAFDFLNSNIVDLVFLDINMPDLSGLELIDQLKNPPYIIFTTAYSEYAVDSYDYDAVDYLLKPIEFDRFYKSIQKLNKLMKADLDKKTSILSKFIFVKDGYKQVKIFFNDILFIQSDGNYLNIITTDKKTMTRMTFSQIVERLPEDLFFRVHNSYIINIKHIDKIENNQIYTSGTPIPIGPSYKDSLFNQISL